MGMTVLLISGAIDLSVGSTVGLTGVVSALLVRDFNVPVALGILLVILIGGSIGFLNGIITTKVRMPALLATLGMMLAVRGVALIVTGGASVLSLPEGFLLLGRGYVSIIPVPIFVMAAVVLLFLFIQQQTIFPLYYYAIGGNRNASILAGIDADKYSIIIFSILGCLAGLAGAMTASRLGAGLPMAGDGIEFDVIIAVVVGGCSIFGGLGTIQGTILGAAIVGVITNGMIMMNIHSFYQMLAKGLLLIIAVGAETIRHRR
jgi:ribose transport system permease protein